MAVELSNKVKKSVQAISDLRDPGVVREVVSQLMSNSLFKDTLLSSLGITALNDQIKSLEHGIDDMEQYSRRNCLKFMGIPESEHENTDKLILDACNDTLGVMVTESDISRTHRVGPINKSYPRDIIVRFISYITRASVYDARFSFFSKKSDHSASPTSSQHPSNKLFVNEALTKFRSTLFSKARFLKKEGHISWTQDGRIVIRNLTGEKHQVTRLNELSSYPDPPPKGQGPRTLAQGRGSSASIH